MADRTSQPAAGVGVRAAYAANAKFLWNAIDPGKNQLTGASTTSAVRGTAVSGPDGTYRHFTNTDGSIDFAVPNTAMSTNGYTLVVGFAAPTASVDITQTIVLPGSLRLELGTTPSGVYATLVHSSVGTAANTFVETVSGFDSEMWTYIATHTGSAGSPANELRQYLLRGDGTVVTTLTETISGPNSSGTSFEVGSSFGNPTQGVYAVLWMAASIDDTEAQAVRSNLWRVFTEIDTSPVITGPTGAAGAGSITHTVNEGSNAAGTWTATGSVSWSLTGTDAADLSISGGVVTKASGNFDFETKASYSFNVVNGSASQAVTLNITNLPELSAPTKSTPTATAAIIGCTVDTSTGTLYGVLTLDNSAPSGLQVEAGQNSAGSGATTVVPTPLTITSAGAKSFAPATVVSGTTRYGWIVLKVGSDYSTVLATGPVYPGTGRPVSDVSVVGWTPTGAGSAAAALSEDAPGSDAEYITSPTLSGVAETASFALDKTYTPDTYSIKVRANVNTGTGNLVVRLLNDSNVSQGVTAIQAINTTPTTYTLPITITGNATRIRVEVTT